ncbi:5' nucleotidase, NT5C type [Flavihumibacter petaseus]|uniref:Putative 5'(3')-deoxyribonucleotidase n=1 Tax=Flavihumibacter petaseus NBRC 106054 TaxID=1220578 RepID=A0A0E9MVV8_9BACT|nr:5'-nucleotidase [Flavihumibacter petaseus]GAO41265.1 putative 5'(3')-deoxyribonucleotidase [Flavihumibacter petaseus NBRC 106054]
MERIAIDMDGVLADVYAQFSDWHYKVTGIRKRPEDVYGLKEMEAFPDARKYVYTPGFFRNAPVIEGSREIMEALNDRYEVFIVSAAMEFPQSLPEKQQWLNEHFPFLTWQQIVFCGSKAIVKADIMIDDHFKNLDLFSGRTLLFDQPHNHLAPDGNHQRVFSWKEVGGFLL